MYDAYVAFHARMRPRALAVITPERRATYAEFDADVNRYAAALQGLGIAPERGVVIVETRQTYRRLVILMALARLGVTSGVSDDAAADLKLSDQAGEASERVIRLSRPWVNDVERAPPLVVASAPRDPDGAARVLLSSGTTKVPRRVASTWRRRIGNNQSALGTYAAGRLGVWSIRTGFDSGLGYGIAVLAWMLGAAVAEGFLSADLPALMERHPTGLIGITPVQLREVLQALPAGFELKPQWRVEVTGASMTAALARAVRARLTPDLFVSYAATECGRVCIGPASLLEANPGAVGWPVPGAVVDVVGPDGGVLPAGEQGEIRIRGESAAAAYIDDPEATTKVFRGGWIYPGDLGRTLADGSLVVEGRADDRMNFGGLKVLPDTLESALAEHPQVVDCAAFAAPGLEGEDDCWMAVVVDGEVTRESLLAQLMRAGARLPMIRFAWAEGIPRNDMGKIDRAALRAQTAAALAKTEA